MSDKNIDKDIERQVVNTMEYYKNIDNLEEIPIDILRVMYKDNLSELEYKERRIASKIRVINSQKEYIKHLEEYVKELGGEI